MAVTYPDGTNKGVKDSILFGTMIAQTNKDIPNVCIVWVRDNSKDERGGIIASVTRTRKL